MVYDIIILGIAGLGFLMGLMKGLVKELASLVGLVAGLILAGSFYREMGEWIGSMVSWSEQTNLLVGWVVVFLGVMLVINLVAHIVTKTLEVVQLGCLNKILGAVFGMAKYLLILSLIFNRLSLVRDHVELPDGKQLEESRLYAPVEKLAPALFPYLKRDVVEKQVNYNIEINI